MKTKLFGLLGLTTLLFISCSKDNDVNVTLKTDGTLTVKVTDNSNTLLTGTKVKLYEDFGDDYLDALNTDSKGLVDFGNVISGTYTLVVDTPKVSGIKYIPIKKVQVVSGLDKSVTINVQEYIGTLKVTFTKSTYLGGGPFAGLNVILVPVERYNSSYTINNLIARAEFSGKTDPQGSITFTTPSTREFWLIVYNDRKYRKNALTSFDLSKDELRKYTYSLDTSLVEY